MKSKLEAKLEIRNPRPVYHVQSAEPWELQDVLNTLSKNGFAIHQIFQLTEQDWNDYRQNYVDKQSYQVVGMKYE